MTRNQRRSALMSEIQKIKTDSGCSRCGYNRCAEALDFHHVNPSTKTMNVSDMISKNRYGRDRIFEEIGKCQIFCKNCHAEETFATREASCDGILERRRMQKGRRG